MLVVPPPSLLIFTTLPAVLPPLGGAGEPEREPARGVPGRLFAFEAGRV